VATGRAIEMMAWLCLHNFGKHNFQLFAKKYLTAHFILNPRALLSFFSLYSQSQRVLFALEKPEGIDNVIELETLQQTGN
jgi:hypothetical protein